MKFQHNNNNNNNNTLNLIFVSIIIFSFKERDGTRQGVAQGRVPFFHISLMKFQRNNNNTLNLIFVSIIIFSFKKNEMAQGRGWPKAGYLLLQKFILPNQTKSTKKLIRNKKIR